MCASKIPHNDSSASYFHSKPAADTHHCLPARPAAFTQMDIDSFALTVLVGKRAEEREAEIALHVARFPGQNLPDPTDLAIADVTLYLEFEREFFLLEKLEGVREMCALSLSLALRALRFATVSFLSVFVRALAGRVRMAGRSACSCAVCRARVLW